MSLTKIGKSAKLSSFIMDEEEMVRANFTFEALIILRTSTNPCFEYKSQERKHLLSLKKISSVDLFM